MDSAHNDTDYPETESIVKSYTGPTIPVSCVEGFKVSFPVPRGCPDEGGDDAHTPPGHRSCYYPSVKNTLGTYNRSTALFHVVSERVTARKV